MCRDIFRQRSKPRVNCERFVFLPVDRPWLKEGQKVQKLQEKVYLALQHSLHKSVSDEKLDKVKPRATPSQTYVRRGSRP